MREYVKQPKHRSVITAKKMAYAWNSRSMTKAGTSISQKRKGQF